MSSKDVPMQPLPDSSVRQSGSRSILPGVLYISILQAEQGEVASKTTKLVLLDSLLQETAHIVRSLYLQEPTGKNLKWRIAAKWTIWTETGSESSKISLP